LQIVRSDREAQPPLALPRASEWGERAGRSAEAPTRAAARPRV